MKHVIRDMVDKAYNIAFNVDGMAGWLEDTQVTLKKYVKSEDRELTRLCRMYDRVVDQGLVEYIEMKMNDLVHEIKMAYPKELIPRDIKWVRLV
jgi:hypothetical protein